MYLSKAFVIIEDFRILCTNQEKMKVSLKNKAATENKTSVSKEHLVTEKSAHLQPPHLPADS